MCSFFLNSLNKSISAKTLPKVSFFPCYRGFILLNLVTDSNLLSHDFQQAFHRDAGSYDLEFNSTKKSGQNFKTADDMIENYSQNCSGIPELWVGIIFLFFYVFKFHEAYKHKFADFWVLLLSIQRGEMSLSRQVTSQMVTGQLLLALPVVRLSSKQQSQEQRCSAVQYWAPTGG